MAKVIARADGIDGKLALVADRVVIRREGLWNKLQFGMGGDREIPLGAILEIKFRMPGKFVVGSIEFVRIGVSPGDQKESQRSTVKFNKKQEAEFAVFKEKAFELIGQSSRKP